MCMTRMSTFDGDRRHHRDAAADVPGDPRPRHRRRVQLHEGARDPGVRAAAGARARRVPDAAGRRRAEPGVPQVHRVLPVPEHLPRGARPRGEQARVRRAALPHAAWPSSTCTRSTRDGDRAREAAGRARPGLLQHHQVLHRGLPRAHQDHRQRADPAEGARGRPQVRPAGVAGQQAVQALSAREWKTSLWRCFPLTTPATDGSPPAWRPPLPSASPPARRASGPARSRRPAPPCPAPWRIDPRSCRGRGRGWGRRRRCTSVGRRGEPWRLGRRGIGDDPRRRVGSWRVHARHATAAPRHAERRSIVRSSGRPLGGARELPSCYACPSRSPCATSPTCAAAYGSWPTPFTSALVVADAVRLGELDRRRRRQSSGPKEARRGGRTQIVRRRPDGVCVDLLPGGMNARTAVHEYGGGGVVGARRRRLVRQLGRPAALPARARRRTAAAHAGARHPAGRPLRRRRPRAGRRIDRLRARAPQRADGGRGRQRDRPARRGHPRGAGGAGQRLGLRRGTAAVPGRHHAGVAAVEPPVDAVGRAPSSSSATSAAATSS